MLPEPWNSMALVFLGSALGGWAFGSSCGCVGRWRWRREWRAVTGRNATDFSESGHTARFLAQQAAARSEARARDLARRSRSEGAL